ncbi:MAG: GlsB/YeaQ/YmgE family stress response membrane protein [Aestuariivirga sp.]
MNEIFQGWFVGNLIVSVIGAVVLLYVVRLIRR